MKHVYEEFTAETIRCMVCEELTTECVPSPFFPYSGWRCKTCQKKHRIPYRDILMVLHGHGMAKNYEERHNEWVEWWGSNDGYLEKYLHPTLEFFGKTTEEAWEESARKNNGL